MSTTGAEPHIAAIYRFPVKGLSPETMDEVALVPGETLPYDRAWAIENGPGRFNPDDPQHLPKITFLMLMRDERLATLKTEFDDKTETLTILRAGKPVARGQLSSRSGRTILEQFFAAYMEKSLRGPPRLMHAPGHSFSDVAAKCLHIVNLASVRELERACGRPIDPLRFRPNLVLDGLEPWVELQWVGRTMDADEASLEIFKRTVRCAATNVDPSTGERDMDIPAVLGREWGHTDFGIYARVTRGGVIRPGTPISLAA
jgi:hypothetical protein